MKIEDYIQYWLQGAKHDFEVAETLFNEEKYDWCLFIGHLVIEKTLKAMLVQYSQKESVVKTHNLLKIAQLANLDLTDEMKLDLLSFNDFNLEVRYPVYKTNFYEKCNKSFAEEYFSKIKESYKCLLLMMQNL